MGDAPWRNARASNPCGKAPSRTGKSLRRITSASLACCPTASCHMKLLGGDSAGFAVDRLQHSLLTATLDHTGGEDEEYVVCALLDDIGRLCSLLSPKGTVRGFHVPLAKYVELGACFGPGGVSPYRISLSSYWYETVS